MVKSGYSWMGSIGQPSRTSSLNSGWITKQKKKSILFPLLIANAMDSYHDEEGEAIMDYEDFQSDPGSPEPRQDPLDDFKDDMEDWGQRERSQTPVYDTDKVGKPRKRMVKKGSSTGKESMGAPELLDEDDESNFQREGSELDAKKRKKEKMHKEKNYGGGSEKGTVKKLGKSPEVNEMWDWVKPENDQEGPRTMDNDDFIDDSGVDPADRYGSEIEARSPGAVPQAEEDDEDPEIKDLFKMGKKRKKGEKSPAEIALLVESVMAELEVTAEEDAELNRQGKPAITKLKLPLLTEVLSKKQLQPEFLDHGVLTLLKNWLQPLPDGSLPNINIRAAILQILTDTKWPSFSFRLCSNGHCPNILLLEKLKCCFSRSFQLI